MLHIYTYGTGSKQFLILTQSQADLVNWFTDRFFEAQEHFMEKNDRRWTPSEPLSFLLNDSRREKLDRYNKLVKWLNLQHKIRNHLFDLFRIDVRDEDFEDYLVKRV